MEPHIFEVFTAVAMFLGGQKGMEFYKRRRFLNGNGTGDMRKNSLSPSDKDFVKDCFSSLELAQENDRLKLSRDLADVIRVEANSTRDMIRSIQ